MQSEPKNDTKFNIIYFSIISLLGVLLMIPLSNKTAKDKNYKTNLTTPLYQALAKKNLCIVENSYRIEEHPSAITVHLTLGRTTVFPNKEYVLDNSKNPYYVECFGRQTSFVIPNNSNINFDQLAQTLREQSSSYLKDGYTQQEHTQRYFSGDWSESHYTATEEQYKIIMQIKSQLAEASIQDEGI